MCESLGCNAIQNMSGSEFIIEPVREKTNNLGSDQVGYKPVCTVTEAG